MKKIYVYIKKIEPYLCKSCNEAPKQHRSCSLRAIYIYNYFIFIIIFEPFLQAARCHVIGVTIHIQMMQ